MFKCICSATCLAALAPVAAAAVIDVPGDHATIQQAVSAAVDGDVVVVAPGTYHESVALLGKAITLRSSAGAESTVIDASLQGQASVIRMVSGEGPDTVLQGFTLTGGSGTFDGSRKKGGGIFVKNGSPTIVDCVVSGNLIAAWDFSVTGSGAGIYVENGAPVIERCTFFDNALVGCSGWLNGGGGAYCDEASPTFTDCQFIENQCNNGGGIMAVGASSAELVNCVFRDNSATFSGGGLNNTNGASATLVNCLFAGNSAYHGAGLYTTGGDVQMSNCTVVQNQAQSTGGGAYLMYATVSCEIANCVFWANQAQENPAGNEIDRFAGALSTVNNSNVQGGWSGPGWANIDVDPAFASAGGGDFHLTAASPCIDSGFNLSVPGDVDTDLEGMPRIDNGTVDMGAHEFQSAGAPPCAADLSGDGLVGVQDLLSLMVNWGTCQDCPPACHGDINGDCFVDVQDIAAMLDAWGDCE